MLDPGHYSQSIKGLENNKEAWENELEEEQFLHFVYSKGIQRLIVGVLLCLVWSGAVLFLVIHTPTRQAMIDILQINVKDVLDVEELDFWKILGILLCVGAIEALIVWWASGNSYPSIMGSMFAVGIFSAGILLLPSGIFLLCVDIKNVIRLRKESLENIQDAQERLEQISDHIEEEKANQTQVLNALRESERIFVQGKRKNNTQLIQKAADMGNPDAVAYLEEMKKKAQMEDAERCFQQAKQGNFVNRQLMEKAASMGHPWASVDMAEYLFEQTVSSRYTKSEKEEMIRTADSYLEQADFVGCPDGEVLRISRQLDRKEIDDPQGVLQRVRRIAESGAVSHRYRKLADSVIERLVAAVDSIGK